MTLHGIRMSAGARGRLIVQVPYSSDHVAKIKTVAGRRWHAKNGIGQFQGVVRLLANYWISFPDHFKKITAVH